MATRKKQKKLPDDIIPIPDTSDIISIPQTNSRLNSERMDNQDKRIADLNNILIAVVLVFIISIVGFVVDAIRFHGEQTVQFTRTIQENSFATDEVELLRLQVEKLQREVSVLRNVED